MKYLFTLLCVVLLAGTSCKHVRTAKKIGETTSQKAKVCLDKAKTMQSKAAIRLQAVHLEKGIAASSLVPDDAIPTRLMIW